MMIGSLVKIKYCPMDCYIDLWDRDLVISAGSWQWNEHGVVMEIAEPNETYRSQRLVKVLSASGVRGWCHEKLVEEVS